MTILTLIERFANGLNELQAKFMEQPRLDMLEKEASDLGTSVIADFLKLTLEDADALIEKSGVRLKDYTSQRKIKRTLITTVGDVTFYHTQYKKRADGSTHFLLDEIMGLPPKERFSEQAEAKVLRVAGEESYQKAADSLKIREQSISKTAVMGKVHDMKTVFREEKPLAEEERKSCKYLYIEADEDHISEQGGGSVSHGFIGKLVYLYEGKEDVCKGKRKLICPHYHGGLYRGHEENRNLWESVQRYIEGHYREEDLERVYISGDGAWWIKAGIAYVDKSVFVLDRFHLMKYINKAANLTLDDREWVKGRLYKYIYQNKLYKVKKLLTKIEASSGETESTAACRSYLTENWKAIQTAFQDEHVYGCSAEGHVSHIYSDRMSSRPMGWGETGSESMCRLRCYLKNKGETGIIDLVRYRRERELEKRKMTGTYGIIGTEAVKKKLTRQQKEIGRYWETLQKSIGGDTARKTLAIREQINRL